jgi:ribosomal-protein-alanine N-acetyltransferase
MSEVLDIEWKSFPYPWGEDRFVKMARKPNVIKTVALHESNVVGYFLYETFTFRSIPGYLEILNFAVHHNLCRNYIGSCMLSRILQRLSPVKRPNAFVRVHDRNLGAQLFFKSNKFAAVAIDYNTFMEYDCPDTAYVMRYTMSRLRPELAYSRNCLINSFYTSRYNS